MKKLLLLTMTAIIAFGMIGCETMPENNNADAVITDETNINSNGIKTDNEIVDADVKDVDGDWKWDNDMDRAGYDKDKAKYEKYRGDKYKDDTVGSGLNDSWLWTKTRAALATTDGLGETTINVDVENEVVTLKGTVDSDVMKKKAVEVAKNIEGVKSVNDKLTINKDDSAIDGADTEKTEMDASTKKEEMKK